jgi:hypothetical protein
MGDRLSLFLLRQLFINHTLALIYTRFIFYVVMEVRGQFYLMRAE